MIPSLLARPSAAHPRAGGENRVIKPGGYLLAGSSPRGRGKLTSHQRSTERRGLIPARAGKTVGSGVGPWPTPAHPRAGGENGWKPRPDVVKRGSSPRGRGKRRFGGHRGGLVRLIPARAGKTALSPPMGWSSTAHPRAGGENLETASLAASCAGSSPRGRGKRLVVYGGRLWLGLIPARAGKTKIFFLPIKVTTAHPRAGGENTF